MHTEHIFLTPSEVSSLVAFTDIVLRRRAAEDIREYQRINMVLRARIAELEKEKK